MSTLVTESGFILPEILNYIPMEIKMFGVAPTFFNPSKVRVQIYDPKELYVVDMWRYGGWCWKKYLSPAHVKALIDKTNLVKE